MRKLKPFQEKAVPDMLVHSDVVLSAGTSRTFKRRAFDMTFEEMKNERVAALVNAAQDCGHYTDYEDLEKKLEYVDFCKGELLFFAADEVQSRQKRKKALRLL
ncbi:hypothetical protein [Desulfotignum balticum]|uniref:hypothetical protein n=1 Tax=Desulfotignum balticum TaxID=115781 RepID=UPI0004148714|nr:hypothetical protein [Desulfotignum balticum]